MMSRYCIYYALHLLKMKDAQQRNLMRKWHFNDQLHELHFVL
jgi:hypothetical protein